MTVDEMCKMRDNMLEDTDEDDTMEMELNKKLIEDTIKSRGNSKDAIKKANK